MVNFKEIFENLTVVQNAAIKLQTWTSKSLGYFLVFYILFIVLICSTVYAPIYLLLREETADTSAHTREITSLNTELRYESAIGAITSCLDSEGSNSKLHDWYCHQAVQSYRRVSSMPDQARVNEVVNLHAYRAMREDVRGYLRFLKFQQVISAPPTGAQAISNIIFSNGIVIVIVTGIAFAICQLAYLFFWYTPRRKMAQSSE